MNWMEACWTVMAAACLTLASIHLLVWNKQRSEKAHLSFSLAGYSIALAGMFELLMMNAASAQEYAALLKWAHVPVALLVAALVAFVRLHLRAGRPWLGHLAWGLRAFALIPNFTTGVNENFREISSLLEVETWGGARYMTPIGVPSSWTLLAQLSNYLLIAFFVDAMITAWRNPSDPLRAKVIRICASLALFVLLAGFWHLAIVMGYLHLPVAVVPAFTGVLLVMSYELGGDVVRAAQLARDLAASQLTLQRSEQRIDDAVLAAGMGQWEWKAASQEFWLSPRARELLGVESDEAFDWNQLRGRTDPADHDAFDAAMDPRQAKGVFMSEFRVTYTDGSQHWLLARGQGECSPEGTPLMLRGVLVDITERKQAAVQRDELAHLSRVALLAELSGSLAHELNQPLTSILSNAQAAQRFMAHEPPNLIEITESLSNIVESDKRAGEVIRRLRAMLRKEPAEFCRVDLNEVVQDVLRLIRSELLAKGVDVHLDLQAHSDSDGDRVQLQQVLLNLVINGVDAMQGRFGNRELTIQTRSAQGGGVELSVSDCGSGIPPADLERIFWPFVTSKEEGMGLGLAVCKTIIDSHRGRLWATNNDDVGASFHFWLPTPSNSQAS